MKMLLALSLLFAALPSARAQQTPDASLYGTGSWDNDSLGNHRIVLRVSKPADAVMATLEWRLRDRHPEEKGVIVVDAATGKQIQNVKRFTVNRERCEIVFQPQTAPGEYYVYYLKSISTGSRYYPTVNYLPREHSASPDWLSKNRLTGTKAPKLPRAELVQYQAVSDFHSFYPMEVIATAAEKAAVLKQNATRPFLTFTEDRRYPIRMTADIPWRWVEPALKGKNMNFEGTADRGEYYAFQLGLWAARQGLHNVQLKFSDLTDAATGNVIPASAFSCINTEGIDVTGTVFRKQVNVGQDSIQALWVGAMVPEQQVAGTYRGTVTIEAEGCEPQTVGLCLHVTNNLIADHGDNEPWRHSRLRWLNSEIAEDDEVVAPYTPVEVDGRTLSILGRDITLSATGLPEKITSHFAETMTGITADPRPILAKPMALEADGGDWENLDFAITKRKPAAVAWKAVNQNGRFLMQLEGELEDDGNITYHVMLIAREDGHVNDIALRTPLAQGIGSYMMGLGEKGGFCPKSFQWKWSVEKNQDAIWVGDVNAGLQLRFYDNRYERPLNTNFYHQKPLVMPLSWWNQGRGGINIQNDASELLAYSGERDVKKGDRLYYYFNILVTPFRAINTNKQWHDRYYHAYQDIDSIARFGATVVNIHHATPINPYINYPFLRPQQMKAYADAAHQKGMKLKIYDTVRELTNRCTELFALRSLGDEVFSRGKGGGYSWLQEHLDQNYIAAWRAYEVDDASILNTGVSRWHNYYLEGLNWLTRHVGIDGLYIDDLAFDRTTMKRVRKILTRNNPGALIDLHSANQFNPKDGFANSANLYLEHFPYLDRLWFGEYFDYDMPPEFWLVEVSGIPYGVMGEMLQNGGNKWRGMVYGMTARNPWSAGVDNRPLWHFWDEFGMKDSQMIGYWVKSCPVKTGRDRTLATVYRHQSGKKVLVSVATWEDQDVNLQLQIDWTSLGINPKKATLHAPAIRDFQQEQTWKPGERITVPKGKGLLIVIE